MSGIKALSKVQFGKETTAGTAVAATAVWAGAGGFLTDERVTTFPKENIGIAGGRTKGYIARLGALFDLPETPLTFEQAMYPLEAGVKAVGTPAADGSGSGKIYAYPMGTNAAPTIKTFTLEAGDDQQEYEAEYCFVEELVISGKPSEALMVSSKWRGRQVGTSSFTGSLSAPAVAEPVLFGNGKLYVDAVSGTCGTTQITQSFIGMEVRVKTGWRAVFTGDGALYFTFAKWGDPEVVVRITFEHDAQALAQYAAFAAGTPKQIRMRFTGSALGTAGTTYSVKTFDVDAAGMWESFEKVDEQDGNDVLTGVFRARYDSTAALFCTVRVVNEVASLV